MSIKTAGDTLFTMLVTLAALWGVQQPLALVLPNLWGLGVYGIGCAMVPASMARLGIMLPYYATGRWMKKNPLRLH